MEIKWQDKKNQFPDISFYERIQHMAWCINNDIKIHFVVKSYNVGFLRINEKGNIKDHCDFTGRVVYYKQQFLKANDEIWSKKLYEIYSELYIKYNPEFIPKKVIERNELKRRN